MPSRNPPRITAHQVRTIAVAASCDPRTVRKVLDGEPVQPMVLARIRRALEALRVDAPARQR